jgi:putative hydrolase of the HAD superfamily
VFAHHGLLELVDVFVMSYEHGVVKPAPELFLAACARLGEVPGRTLMVGDNPLADGGAVGIGLPTYLVPIAEPGRPRGLDGALRLAGVGAG